MLWEEMDKSKKFKHDERVLVCDKNGYIYDCCWTVRKKQFEGDRPNWSGFESVRTDSYEDTTIFERSEVIWFARMTFPVKISTLPN